MGKAPGPPKTQAAQASPRGRRRRAPTSESQPSLSGAPILLWRGASRPLLHEAPGNTPIDFRRPDHCARAAPVPPAVAPRRTAASAP